MLELSAASLIKAVSKRLFKPVEFDLVLDRSAVVDVKRLEYDINSQVQSSA